MSPVSLMKVSDPGNRVQVPLMSSVTCTCSGASNWENHPTSRSPWPTERVSGTVSVETRDPVENAAPWTKVGVVDWATAQRGSGTPRAAITARAAADRADGEWFTVIHSAILAASRRGAGEGSDEELGTLPGLSRQQSWPCGLVPGMAAGEEQDKCHEGSTRHRDFSETSPKKRAQRSCANAGRPVALADATG